MNGQVIMDREEAILKISVYHLSKKSQDELYDFLQTFWPPDDELPQLASHPWNSNEFPENMPEKIDTKEYYPILISSMYYTFLGVTNAYLEFKLKQYFEISCSVVEDLQSLNLCPCCHRRTLRKNREYFICEVCKWEDDGTTDEFVLSTVNRETISEARKKFLIEEAHAIDRYAEIMLKYKNF